MVLNEPKIVGRRLRRQGIAALQVSDGASDLEGANPLAPPTFLAEATVGQVHYTAGSSTITLGNIHRFRGRGVFKSG